MENKMTDQDALHYLEEKGRIGLAKIAAEVKTHGIVGFGKSLVDYATKIHPDYDRKNPIFDDLTEALTELIGAIVLVTHEVP